MQPRRILVNKKLGTSVWHVDNNMASNEELVLMAMLLLDEDDEDIKEKKTYLEPALAFREKQERPL